MIDRLIGWAWGLLVCLLITLLLGGCKGKQTVVESVRYVHDTAYSTRDSIVYRTLTFGGTVEERTAEWTSKGDSVRNAPDTVWRWRYRTVAARSLDSSRTMVESVRMEQREEKSVARPLRGRGGVFGGMGLLGILGIIGLLGLVGVVVLVCRLK